MTVTYCTSDQVAQFLGVTSYSSSTNPTKTVVEEFINRKENWIDTRINHAFRETSVSDEIHSIRSTYMYERGVMVSLLHRSVRNFDSSKGDKLEIWNGTEWEDWLDSSNGKTEGRDEDFWVDYKLGIVYIFNYFFYTTQLVVRVTYRYGESSVPADIEDICIKLVAIDLVANDDRYVRLPETTNGLSLDDKIRRWKEDAKEIISERSEPVRLDR